MMRLYSIRDAKTQAFSTPFFQQNDETALRMFRDELHGSNGPSMLSKHPEDFDLYCVGDWNDTSGAVRPTGFAFFKKLGIIVLSIQPFLLH